MTIVMLGDGECVKTKLHATLSSELQRNPLLIDQAEPVPVHPLHYLGWCNVLMTARWKKLSFSWPTRLRINTWREDGPAQQLRRANGARNKMSVWGGSE